MDICTILDDTYRMLLAHGSSIEQSAAHVLQSVLPNLATNSLLRATPILLIAMLYTSKG